MKVVDYLIIGQGIAGTMLSWKLMKKGMKVHVIDQSLQQSSSFIAGGIINPITGRNFVKSWRIDEFLPVAKESYQELSQLLGHTFFYDYPVIRLINNNQKENLWFERAGEPGYEHYMIEKPQITDINYINNINQYGAYHTINAGKVDSSLLLGSYRNYLKSIKAIDEIVFKHDKITFLPEGIIFNPLQISAKALIYCDGNKSVENPFFENLPFSLTKGEFFILKIPNIQMNYLLKGHKMLVPLYGEYYWYGASYSWKWESDEKLEAGDLMKQELDDWLGVPYEIITHQTGIRPTTVDRRPVMRQSKIHKSVFMFSGMGSKGFSQAPLLADEFIQQFGLA